MFSNETGKGKFLFMTADHRESVSLVCPKSCHYFYISSASFQWTTAVVIKYCQRLFVPKQLSMVWMRIVMKWEMVQVCNCSPYQINIKETRATPHLQITSEGKVECNLESVYLLTSLSCFSLLLGAKSSKNSLVSELIHVFWNIFWHQLPAGP